ncbi:LYR motif-containing protein 5A isoform X1 [Toxotes jaculatrix]|uniref:LYR motif-containing protein 5A isoform X1 n=1 Tax=Toxotes jaculatrix TaxID=941984 RepID=UPI001B3AE76B|nr:LYR motif-containing protein 5A isoform X1 [Toxotes jaculatrix]
MANPLRGEVIRLYKNCVFRHLKLLYLGREYPQGSAYFRERLKSAFMKNKDVTDPEKIKKLVARGEFVIKELEALYFLRKYRAMKKRYYEPEK